MGVRHRHILQTRRAQGLYLDGSPNDLPSLDYVLLVAAPEILDGAFAVGSKEGPDVVDVLFQGGRLPLQLLLELVLRAGVEPQ